jgi:ATP-dependent RNA helicase RhlE
MLMKFEDLGLAESLVRAVHAQGYHTPTKIQAAAITPILAGRDVLGCAQTGTGKTAAFALPTLHRLSQVECKVNGRGRKIRTLVLSPTRELALQICESFQVYGKHTNLRHTVVYGGVGQGPQVRALNAGVDILVATPGRLCDLMQQGFIDLSKVEVLILDEADRMLDMGFLPDLRRIVDRVPKQRQTLLFSATMAPEIRKVANAWLTDPVDVEVTPAASTVVEIEQSVVFVEKRQKLTLLTHWLQETPWTRTLVFTRTKHGADKVAKGLIKAGIQADSIHGNKSQMARQRALVRFKLPKPLVLVATDIAARGLDIDQISHVVNFDLPDDPESYVHRIGRTGRAGATGKAISLCDREERSQLQAIQRLTRQTLTVGQRPKTMPAPSPEAEKLLRAAEAAESRPGRGGSRPQRGGQSRRAGGGNANGGQANRSGVGGGHKSRRVREGQGQQGRPAKRRAAASQAAAPAGAAQSAEGSRPAGKARRRYRSAL